jgi:hypothetical protein
MTPPPTSIDGTDITGATIDGTEVTEITIDGQTVFSPAPEIPASAIHRYKKDEGSGTTANDDIASADISYTSISWVSDTRWVGDTSTLFNGINDEGTATIPGYSNLSELMIAVTFIPKDTSAQNQRFITFDEDSGFSLQRLDYNGGGNNKLRFRVGDTTEFRSATSTTSFTNTDIPVRVLGWAQENGEVRIYINGIKEASTSIGAFGDVNDSFSEGFSARTGGDHANCILDDLTIYDTVSESTVDADYNRQPYE